MELLDIKMDLKFPSFPFIYSWIEHDYNKCETEFDYMDFVQNCIEESNNSTNEVRKKAYSDTAHAVYSKLTNKSLESYRKTIEKLLKNG